MQGFRIIWKILATIVNLATNQDPTLWPGDDEFSRWNWGVDQGDEEIRHKDEHKRRIRWMLGSEVNCCWFQHVSNLPYSRSGCLFSSAGRTPPLNKQWFLYQYCTKQYQIIPLSMDIKGPVYTLRWPLHAAFTRESNSEDAMDGFPSWLASSIKIHMLCQLQQLQDRMLAHAECGSSPGDISPNIMERFITMRRSHKYSHLESFRSEILQEIEWLDLEISCKISVCLAGASFLHLTTSGENHQRFTTKARRGW